MFLGTPQTTFTVYRKLAERSYKPFVWPARYPRKVSQYEGLLAPQLVADIDNGAEPWNVTDPDRFADDDLIEREAAMGRSTSFSSSCWIPSLSDVKNSHLKWLTLSSPLLILLLLLTPSSGAQTLQTSSKNYRLLDYLEIISTVQCAIQGEWHPYQETICSVDPSGRGTDETAAAFISQRNGFLYLHKMCAYRDGYSVTTHSWTF